MVQRVLYQVIDLKKADQGSVSMLVSIRFRTQISATRGRVFSRISVTQHIRDNFCVEYGIVVALGSAVDARSLRLDGYCSVCPMMFQLVRITF